MAIVNHGALIDVLQHCNLLPAQQLGEVLALVDERGAEVADVAKTLVERGWFTPFQMTQLLAGRGEELTVGPYVIVDRLGKSGKSAVYKARHLESECLVALKVMRAEQLGTPAAVNQFLHNMEALAELEHPHIVQFCDADKAGDAYYCAMELVEGSTLDKVVRQEGRLSPAVAAQYIRQTALGLQCAHEHNLIHRDIKPANLFLTHPAPSNSPLTTTTLPGGDRGREEGRGEGRVGGGGSLIKILDWGLATLRPTAATAEEAAPKASEHNLVGTADYLSPEQAMNPQGVDIRGDIYSLGCTLYFLLTGQTPFSGVSVMQKALQHMTAEPEPVEKLNPEVSRGLGNIVRRMMAKQPGDRFQTPAAAALALSAFCRNPLAAAVKSRNAAKTLLAVEGVRPPDDTPMSPMLD